MAQPSLIIGGGANGSGKTIIAREFVSADNLQYLGADDIASELNLNEPETAAIQAARLFSQRLNDLLKQPRSLIVESTLSGLSLRKRIEKARCLNYEIGILFVYLDSAELCIERVKSRVLKGGHHVPEMDVRRRFERANQNFWHIYKDLADEWNLFYNAGAAIIQVAGGDKSTVSVLAEKEYQKWLKMAETETKSTNQ